MAEGVKTSCSDRGLENPSTCWLARSEAVPAEGTCPRQRYEVSEGDEPPGDPDPAWLAAQQLRLAEPGNARDPICRLKRPRSCDPCVGSSKRTGVPEERRAGRQRVFVNRFEIRACRPADRPEPVDLMASTNGQGIFLGRGLRRSELAQGDTVQSPTIIDGAAPPTPIANPSCEPDGRRTTGPAETMLFFVARWHGRSRLCREHGRA